jgi:hypothetical protein
MASKASKRRGSLIIYGIFTVILITLVLYIVLRKSDRMQYGLPEVPAVEAELIDYIAVERGSGDKIELSREGGSWEIGPDAFKADQEAVEGMVEALADFRISDLVSTSEYYDRYELDQANALRITARGGNATLRSFLMGKRAPSYNHTYVRLDDDVNVYHAASDLTRIFDKERNELREKQVLSFMKDDVIRVVVTLPDRNFQLFKSSPEVGGSDQTAASASWKSSDEEEWEAQKVTEFLDRIDDLSCTSFLDGAATDLGTPKLTLQIHTLDQHTLYLFDKDDTGYRARSSQTPYPFYVSTWIGDSILETFAQGTPDDQ